MNSTSPENLEIMSKKNRSKNRQASKIVEEAEKYVRLTYYLLYRRQSNMCD